MKNLNINIEASEVMDRLKFQIKNEGFNDVEYSFCIYKLLMQLYEYRKDDILISVDTFLQEIEKRGAI